MSEVSIFIHLFICITYSPREFGVEYSLYLSYSAQP